MDLLCSQPAIGLLHFNKNWTEQKRHTLTTSYAPFQSEPELFCFFQFTKHRGGCPIQKVLTEATYELLEPTCLLYSSLQLYKMTTNLGLVHSLQISQNYRLYRAIPNLSLRGISGRLFSDPTDRNLPGGGKIKAQRCPEHQEKVVTPFSLARGKC